MKVEFSDTALKEYRYWCKKDAKTAAAILTLIQDICRNGALIGKGKPEKLKYCVSYSRRIDKKHRLVYTVSGDILNVETCYGHYED